MTVTYSGQVANARMSAFSRLLFYWRGSIYKLMYKEMFVFIGLYASCSLVYRFALNPAQREIFEKISLHCERFTNLIPLSFVLGFYVAIVVTRWWNQFLAIPWPDRVGLCVATLIEGFDDHARLVRRTIMRYIMQSTLLVFQNTSVSVKKRFPTVEHLIEAGLMTPNEQKMMEEVNTPHGRWWVPFNWCFNLIKDLRIQGLITDDYLMKTIMEEVMSYRSSLGMLYNYDWISIPLVYTQVTTLAVYTFFIGCILGRQFLDPLKGYVGHEVDIYVPVFTVLQFFFYMGWMKVAEQMINPFGEDDDDFDMNWIIDRNMQLSMLFVDDMFSTYPKLEKDIYWDEQAPAFLPYTKSAISSITKPFMGSTAQISISEDQMKIINPMETIREEQSLGVSHSHLRLASGMESKINSTMVSPLSSPSTSRHHITNNLLMANHLTSLSKTTLDGLKHLQPENKLLQTLHGASTLPKPPAYIDGWLNQEPGSRFDISSVPAHLPSPLTHQRVLSQAMAREASTPAGFDYDSCSMLSLEKPLSSVAPSVTPSIAPSISVIGVAASLSTPSNTTVRYEDEKQVPQQPKQVPQQAKQVPQQAKQVPQVGEVDGEKGEVPGEQQAVLEQSSSSESLPEFEGPDANQCTVSSLTPLLDSTNSQAV